jgi:hypothetical protein
MVGMAGGENGVCQGSCHLEGPDFTVSGAFSTQKNGGPKAAVGVLLKKPFPGAKSISL